jgi:hypothetical protein
MNELKVRFRASRSVTWTLLSLSVINLVTVALSGCGSHNAMPSTQGRSVEDNADYQKTIRDADMRRRTQPGARPSGAPSAQPSGMPR